MERPHARPHAFSTSSVTLENWEETDTDGGGAAHDTSLVASELLNVAAQTVVPAWVRARALAVYLLVFNGGMATGSVLWGVVAAHVGTPMAFVSAALGLTLSLTAIRRYRLVTGEALDLTPSPPWSDPPIANIPRSDAGPVLVMVEYRIDPRQARDFAAAMRALRVVRRRDGAIRWGMYGDVADPGRYVETFVVASWAEHLRQHERVTMADRVIQQRVRAFPSAMHHQPLPISSLRMRRLDPCPD